MNRLEAVLALCLAAALAAPARADIGAAQQIPGPPVAHDATPVRYVFPMGDNIAVVNAASQVWVHAVGARIGAAHQISGPPVAGDREKPPACFALGPQRIGVINAAGQLWVHDVGERIGGAHRIPGATIATQGAKSIFPRGQDEIAVIDGGGALWVYKIGAQVMPAQRVPGAAIAQGGAPARYFVSFPQGVGVINDRGELWFHAVGAKVDSPRQIAGPAIAADKIAPLSVFAMGDRVLVDNAAGQIWAHAISGLPAAAPAPAPTGGSCSCRREQRPHRVCETATRAARCPTGLPADLCRSLPAFPVTSCSTRVEATLVCSGDCPPPETHPRVAADPKQAFTAAHAARPEIAAQISSAKKKTDDARQTWDTALGALNALANNAGQLGNWVTKNVCTKVQVTVSGSCKASIAGICVAWWPDSVEWQDQCGDQQQFDPVDGQAFKDAEQKAHDAYDQAVRGFNDLVRKVDAEGAQLFGNRCELAVRAMSGEAQPELKAVAQAVAAAAPPLDGNAGDWLKQNAAKPLGPDAKKYLDEGVRLSALVKQNLAQVKALFTADNVCHHPERFVAGLESLGIKPGPGFLASRVPLQAGRRYAAADDSSKHFFMSFDLSGSMAAVLGYSDTFSFITDWRGHSTGLVVMGPSLRTNVAAGVDVTLTFYPQASLDDFSQPVDDIASWSWVVAGTAGDIAEGTVGIVYPGTFVGPAQGFIVGGGVGVGVLPADGTVAAVYPINLVQ